jgi:hypothetical protein
MEAKELKNIFYIQKLLIRCRNRFTKELMMKIESKYLLI